MTSLSPENQPETSAAAIRVAGTREGLEAAIMRGPVIASLLVGGLVVGLFFVFLSKQVQWAFRAPSDWGHTLVIPFIALYFVYLNRRQLLAAGFKTTWIGLVPVVLGVGWYFLCSIGPPAITHHNLQGLGLSVTVFGLLLLFFGWRAMAYLWFPLLYVTAFGMTVSDRFMNLVTFELQDIAARGSYYLLRVIQVDVEISGNTLTIFSNGVPHPLNIAEACSGMRMLVAFLALGVLMAYTGLQRTWQRVALVLLAVPTALFVNVLRVVTLGLLSLIDQDLAGGDFHGFIGLVWLIPALLIYLGLRWVLQKIVIEEDAAPAPRRKRARESKHLFDRHARTAVIVACAALAFSGFGFWGAVSALNIHLAKKPVPLRKDLDTIARRIGAWQTIGGDRALDDATIEALGTTHYLNRAYAIDGDPTKGWLDVHVAYYTGMIDAIPHVPERCWAAGGLKAVDLPRHVSLELDQTMWFDDPGPPDRSGERYRMVSVQNPVSLRRQVVRLPQDDVVLRVSEFQDPNRTSERRIAGYFFIANGRATPRAERVRALAFNKTNDFAYYAKVEFAMIGADAASVDRFVELSTDLLDGLLPEVMRCLPDWAEVERGDYPITSSNAETRE